MTGLTVAQQNFPQDNNLILFNGNVTNVDANATSFMDFNVPGGAPEDSQLVIEVGTLPTGKTLNVELRESTDKFVGNDTDTLYHIDGIDTTGGTFVIPINNQNVKQRSFRPKFKPQSFSTGQVVAVKAYMTWE